MKAFYKGSEKYGSKIIEILEKAGGINIHVFTATCSGRAYYIDEFGIINARTYTEMKHIAKHHDIVLLAYSPIE